MMGERLRIVPVNLRDANRFVAEHHRHHPPARGCRFTLGVATEDGILVGVAIVGRPVARHLDDGSTLEVNRTATDGTPNANSALYGAAWRAARALGYGRLVTFTQADESGASLRGAGWRVVGERPARFRPNWTRWNRAANPSVPIQRTLWEAPAR